MLHAEPTTVNLAFPPLKQYAIPSYQRNYVWTREGQWEPLWDDLRALTQQVLDEGETPAAKPHFLGTIITKQIPTTGFINRWWVVDGQQRLTTLQILMAAACSVFNERGLTQCTSILKGALVNPQEAVQATSDRYKIQHRSSDYSGFSGIVEAGLGGSDVLEAEGANGRLHDCYAYFRKTVTGWLPDENPDGHATAITQAILGRLQVVDIRLGRVNTKGPDHGIVHRWNSHRLSTTASRPIFPCSVATSAFPISGCSTPFCMWPSTVASGAVYRPALATGTPSTRG